jgi:uncharacterized protein YajQ (UPF0234 family)
LGQTWETDKVAAARTAVDFGPPVTGPHTKESRPMAQENSFDIVSKVDIQEVRNAIDQALKEIRQRFDLKDSRSEITLVESDKEIQLASAGEYKLEAVKEILGQKLVKRGVSLKNLTYEKLEQATGQSVRQKIKLQQGIPIEKAKESFAWSRTQKRKPRPASKAIQSEYPVKIATNCRASSLYCGARIWAWICSSPTTAPTDHMRWASLSQAL